LHLTIMCIYTAYQFCCGHPASYRTNDTNNRFLSKTCEIYPMEGKNCRSTTEEYVTIPITCRRCGGPRDPRVRSYPPAQGMMPAWHILEKEVLVTFDELDWTVRKGGQGVVREQSVSPKSESNDPKANSGTGTGLGQNKEPDGKREEEADEGPDSDPANNC
jgi:hypothetical protein